MQGKALFDVCGIAGLLSIDPETRPDADAVRRMCDAMVYRGPDDQRLREDGPCVLGHRRLSIIEIISSTDRYDETAGAEYFWAQIASDVRVTSIGERHTSIFFDPELGRLAAEKVNEILTDTG